MTPAYIERVLPPLATRKDPRLAALIGLLTGGIGLAIYFRSLKDFLPVDITAGLVVIAAFSSGANPLGVAGFVAPVIGGIYGWWRATESNGRLAQAA